MTHLVVAAGTRVERPLVERDIEDTGIVVEDLLGAVAVVRVVVHDRARAPAGRERGGRDRHVVDEAEAHSLGRPRVVAGRAEREERGVRRAVRQRVDGRDSRARRGDGRAPRVGREHRVRVQVAAARTATRFEHLEVRRRVDPLELRRGGIPRGQRDQRLAQPRPLDPLVHRHQTGRPLRVATTRVVELEHRVRRDEQHTAHGNPAGNWRSGGGSGHEVRSRSDPEVRALPAYASRHHDRRHAALARWMGAARVLARPARRGLPLRRRRPAPHSRDRRPLHRVAARARVLGGRHERARHGRRVAVHRCRVLGAGAAPPARALDG